MPTCFIIQPFDSGEFDMVCSESRMQFPFDVQHRKIIRYSSGSPSDFEKLKSQISEIAEAYLKQEKSLKQITSSQRVALTDGLDRQGVLILAVLASHTAISDSTSNVYMLKEDVERSGLTSIGFGLALRSIVKKRYVEIIDIDDDFGEGINKLTQLSSIGWEWMSRNENLFVLSREESSEPEQGGGR